MYKAYRINVKDRKFSEVQIGNYKDIYPHLGECVSLFQCVNVGKGDALYVDEEGLLKPQEHFFMYKGYPQPLAGNALLIGTGSKGESRAPKMSLEALKKNILFMDRNDVGLWASLQKKGR
jgi:hypothetical protein